MKQPIDRLTLDFLLWVAHQPRTYAEAMDAWRTSCPRLTIWEDALHDGLIQVNGAAGRDQSTVSLTPRGRAMLEVQG